MALPQVEEEPPVRAVRRIAGFKVAGKSFVGVEVRDRSMTVSLPEKEARAQIPSRRRPGGANRFSASRDAAFRRD